MSGLLKLQVCRATLTRDVYIIETMDPFFVASISPHKSYTSSVKDNQGKYPIWNEDCEFQVAKGDNNLIIAVYTGEKEVGRACINIQNAIVPLGTAYSEKEIPLTYNGNHAGSLVIRVCFTAGSFGQYGANMNCPQYDSGFAKIAYNNMNYNNDYNYNNINNFNNMNDYSQNFPNYNDLNNNYNNFNNQNFNNNFNQPNFNNMNQMGNFNQPNFNNMNQMNNFNQPNFNNMNQMNNFNQPNFNNMNQMGNFNNYNQNLNTNCNFTNYFNQMQQTPEFWKQWLTYSKNPLFLKSRSPDVYFGNLAYRDFKLVNKVNFDFPHYSSKCELPDGSIFVSGGDFNGDTITTCFIYSQNFGVIYKQSMNMPRKLHSSIYMDGYVYVFGGFDGTDIKNYCEKYDVKNNTWSVIAPMAVNRAYTSILRYGSDFIFVIGGARAMGDEGFIETNSIERYDIKNNRFDLFQITLPRALYGVCSFLVSNSKILIFGGFNTVKGNNYKVFTIDLSNGSINYLKDIENDVWTTMSPFYYNNSICVISSGEEVDDDMPYIFEYPIYLPLK